MMKQQTASEPRSVDAIASSYINSSGDVIDGYSPCFTTTSVSISSGQTISFYGSVNTAAASIYIDDGNGNRIAWRAGGGLTSYQTFSLTAPSDGYVRITASYQGGTTSFDIDGETITINF